MTNPSKKEITAKVIEQLPEAMRMFTVEECMRRWWATGSSGTALRLTEMGDTMFRVAEIEFYQYDFIVKIEEGHHGYILDMSKKLKCPYYLGVVKEQGKKNKPYIRLYDSKIAMMISLYGDIDSYLKSIRTGR
jgi:hypothetical protein